LLNYYPKKNTPTDPINPVLFTVQKARFFLLYSIAQAVSNKEIWEIAGNNTYRAQNYGISGVSIIIPPGEVAVIFAA